MILLERNLRNETYYNLSWILRMQFQNYTEDNACQRASSKLQTILEDSPLTFRGLLTED